MFVFIWLHWSYPVTSPIYSKMRDEVAPHREFTRISYMFESSWIFAHWSRAAVQPFFFVNNAFCHYFFRVYGPQAVFVLVIFFLTRLFVFLRTFNLRHFILRPLIRLPAIFGVWFSRLSFEFTSSSFKSSYFLNDHLVDNSDSTFPCELLSGLLGVQVSSECWPCLINTLFLGQYKYFFPFLHSSWCRGV